MMNLQGTRITWLGHSTVLVQTAKGTNILIDPFITGNPRFPKDFALPEKIHFILATHGHSDHIGDTVPVAAKLDLPCRHLRAGQLCCRQGRGSNNRHESGRRGATERRCGHHGRGQDSSSVQDRIGDHYAGVAAGFVLTVADGPGPLPCRRYGRLWRHESDC